MPEEPTWARVPGGLEGEANRRGLPGPGEGTDLNRCHLFELLLSFIVFFSSFFLNKRKIQESGIRKQRCQAPSVF